MILAAWLSLVALAAGPAAHIAQDLEVRPHVVGSEHDRAAALLASEFDTVFASSVILLVEGVEPERTPQDTAILRDIVARVGAEPGVARTLSYLDGGDSLFLGEGGVGAVILIALEPDLTPEAMLARLRAAAQSAAPEHALSWTGEDLLNAELREFAAREAVAAELRALPIVLTLLLIAFGSLIAALLPVGLGVLAVVLALALSAGAAALGMDVSIVVVNVATMLGLGLTIDYALLMVSRFREELAHSDAPEAARRAAVTAGRTIFISGCTFAMALGALLLVPVNEIRSVALGGLAVTAAAVLAANTLLPTLLSFIAARVDWLSPLRRFVAAPAGLWDAWGRVVFAQPLLVLTLGLAPLVFLAAHCLRLDVNLPRGSHWLPASSQSVQTLRRMNTMGRGGVFHAVEILVSLPQGEGFSLQENWLALEEYATELGRDPRVARVGAITQIAAVELAPWEWLEEFPPQVLAAYLSRDRSSALIAVVPRDSAQPFELAQLVRDIRARGPPQPGASILVSGGPALNADYTDAITANAWLVGALILSATFVMLVVGYRTILLPLKAVALNLVSVAASLGVLVLVFQDGWGLTWLGVDAPLGGVFPNIPIVVFGIVYGLSMDYEVFLFNRVVEAHRAGADDRAAMSLALSHTAGVITSAAAIMIVVFAAFTWGEFLFIKMLGFTLAAAILIDATLVRLVVAPAIFALAGRWNWWPGDGKRLAHNKR